MKDMSNWEAPLEPRLQLTPHGVVEFQLVKFLSPIRGLAVATFVLCVDTSSSDFTIDVFDEVMVWRSCLDETIEPVKHIPGISI